MYCPLKLMMMMIRNYNDHNDEDEDSYWFDNNVDNKKDFYEYPPRPCIQIATCAGSSCRKCVL